MDMFTNYQHLSELYRPNNLSKAFPTEYSPSKLNPVEASKPYEEYDVKGELEGYFWRYGESVNLEFNIDGEVTVESDAVIYRASGQTPMTEGEVREVGTRAYNVVDMISWECVAVDDTSCEWRADTEFTYPTGAEKVIYVSATDYLKDKSVKVTLYNFRFESIYEWTYKGSPRIIMSIEPDVSSRFTKGIYYCSVEVIGKNTHQTIFAPQDCKLLVK